MLLSRFKKIHGPRPSGPAKNRIGLTRRDEDSRKISKRRIEIIMESSKMHRAQIRIYPSEICGGIGVN